MSHSALFGFIFLVISLIIITETTSNKQQLAFIPYAIVIG